MSTAAFCVYPCQLGWQAQRKDAYYCKYSLQVREALQHIPGKYEDFLQIIYEFESSTQMHSAVDLFKNLQTLLRDWPQLLKDFAAFLLPEQALSCGLVSPHFGGAEAEELE